MKLDLEVILLLDYDGKVVGTISRYHLISNHKKKVIQVDHNERGQSVDGLDEAEVLEIIDHHRVADIQTSNPIYFRNEPLGSTSTIVAKCFFENGIKPSKEAAGLIMWSYNFWYSYYLEVQLVQNKINTFARSLLKLLELKY